MKKGHLSFSVLCWLNKHRCKKGKPAIYLRISVAGQRMEISTYQYVDPQQWDQAAQKVKGSSQEAANINRQLATMKGDIHRHYSLLLAVGKPVTLEALRNAYKGVTEQGKTICEAFQFHNRRFADKVKAGLKSADTLKHHEVTRRKVATFIKSRFKTADKPLKEITFSFAPDFEHYLTTIEGIASNTAMKHVKVLKQVLKMAVEQGWLPNNPLDGFKCSYIEPERERLTMDEIMTLYRKELHPRLAEVRDIYLFCCFTGFAFTDVLQLTPEHVVTGIDGEKWVTKSREKTQTRENVPLLPIAMQIIERYRDDKFCRMKNCLLPVSSNQKFNAYLKEIAAICNINRYLTSHTARHTFATTVTLEQDVPIETVSQLLGHKSIRTTQIYAKVTHRKISNNMSALRDKLFGDDDELKERRI